MKWLPKYPTRLCFREPFNLFYVSYLRNVYWSKRQQARVLHQSQVTEWAEYHDWSAFVTGFLDRATLPTVPTSKMETYGWTPTLFMPTPVDFFDPDSELEIVRHGNCAAETLSLFIADLDNHTDGHPTVSFDDVAGRLTGYRLSHLLYTSFSHTEAKHKVRIVIPVDRHLTPDEAFTVFTVLNYDLNFQLDGSIYDPGDHLYGPNTQSRVAHHTDGALCVDDWLALAEQIPDDAKTFVQRHARTETRDATPAEIASAKALASTLTQTGDVTITNPAYFNPVWLDDLSNRSVGGSRHQTVLSILTKAWIKSGQTLSRGDLAWLQMELDAELGGYLRRQYGSAALDKDISAVMRVVPNTIFEPIRTNKQQQIEKEIARLKQRSANK